VWQTGYYIGDGWLYKEKLSEGLGGDQRVEVTKVWGCGEVLVGGIVPEE
jgi:hypothetical protein